MGEGEGSVVILQMEPQACKRNLNFDEGRQVGCVLGAHWYVRRRKGKDAFVGSGEHSTVRLPHLERAPEYPGACFSSRF